MFVHGVNPLREPAADYSYAPCNSGTLVCRHYRQKKRKQSHRAGEKAVEEKQ
jgi:hypothetical protein